MLSSPLNNPAALLWTVSGPGVLGHKLNDLHDSDLLYETKLTRGGDLRNLLEIECKQLGGSIHKTQMGGKSLHPETSAVTPRRTSEWRNAKLVFLYRA